VKLKPVKRKRLIKVVKKVLPFSTNYTGEYRENFPWKPKIKHFEIVESLEQLMKLHNDMMVIPAFAFDTETNTLNVLSENRDFKCVGISISWGENNNYYIPLGHVRDEDIDRQLDLDVVIKYLKPVFERPDVRIYGWNLKFDFHVVKRLGITIKTRDIFDGMLASWLCNENTPNGLKENSQEKLGIEQTHFKEATSTVPNEVKKAFGYKANSKVTFDLVLIDDGAPYAIADAFYTWCNCIGFEKELVKEKMDVVYYKMYTPFLFVLFDMEEQGVTVDIPKLKKMGEDMQKDLDELQYKIYELAGVEFNIGSSQQKAEILFGYQKDPKAVDPQKLPTKKLRVAWDNQDEDTLDKYGYYISNNGRLMKRANSNDHILDHSFNFKPIAFTKNGVPSTDNDTIWRLSRKTYKNKASKRKQQGVEMCNYLMEYAKLEKLKTAFVDGILDQLYEDGKAHPNFNQIGTDSGRISCSSPNLQQLPKADEDDKYQIRSVFIGSIDPNTGKRKKIIALDYHNLEMVCLTHFSGDKNLSRMFANDDDAHGSTAVNMFNLDCKPVECKKKYPHLRQAAKTINFLLMYGGGAKLLYERLKDNHSSPLDLGSPDYLKQYHCKRGEDVAQIFIDKYFASYSGVAKFIHDQKKFAHRNKYVYTILGRKRRLPDINSSDMKKSSYCERLAVNSAIQGTAGDITINAQIRVANEQRLKDIGCNMMIQIHDELVFECPEEYVDEAIKIVKNDMEHPFGDDPRKTVKYLRADADFGDTYQDAK
jgi:DNA polymerase-1